MKELDNFNSNKMKRANEIKKAQSGILTTILIIVIILVAIIILWNVVFKVINEGTEKVKKKSSLISVAVNIEEVSGNNFIIKRTIGGGSLEGEIGLIVNKNGEECPLTSCYTIEKGTLNDLKEPLSFVTIEVPNIAVPNADKIQVILVVDDEIVPLTDVWEYDGSEGTYKDGTVPLNDNCEENKDCEDFLDYQDYLQKAECYNGACIQISNGLIAYYPFEGNANDISENNNHGIPVGYPAYVERKTGDYALSIDGDDYIRILDNDIWDFKNNYAISFWYYLDVGTNSGTNYPIISNEYYMNYGTIIRIAGASLAPYFRTNFPASPYHSFATKTGFAPSKEIWHNLVYVKESGLLKLYWNGDEIFSKPITDAADSSRNLLIGRDFEILPSSQFFKGKIDNVMIFNRALSPTEVQAIYNNQE